MDKKDRHFLNNVARIIVDRRNLFFFLFSIATLFSVFSMSWVGVENELTAYLEETTETRQGLQLMEDAFVTFATAEVMLNHIPYDEAKKVAETLEGIDGVLSVTFDSTPEHYKDASGLLHIMFEGEQTETHVLEAMEEVRVQVAMYDTAINTTVGATVADVLAKEMNLIMVIAVVIIIVVLLFTSKTYGEIVVLLMTFGAAALLNMGTNYWFGTISFISNSVAVVLQLALAIDYAIILCHRFFEERVYAEAREACIEALAKAIPEIASSSLTTVSGLFALSFMSFGIGGDLAMVLIKAILISLLCVFTLMPGLLVITSGMMDRTKHRSFVPSIAKLGHFAIRTRYIVPPIFLVVAIISFWLSNQTMYLFGVSEVRALRQSEAQKEADRVKDKFGKTNALAIIVPSGDYEKEAALIQAIESYEQVESVTALANTEALDGYMLTDALTPRAFSELMDLDYQEAQLLYATYALDEEDYGKIVNDFATYQLPLIDVTLFLSERVDEGYITLEDDLKSELDTQSKQIRDGKKQLESDAYSRMLVALSLPEEGDETFSFLETLKATVNQHYEENYLVGNATSNKELAETFHADNLMISLLSALFVVVVLLFTFRSVGAPLLLIIVIQSAIFMNFAVPYIQGKGLFFIGYLVVSAIQMGANVDYAIVMTNRYMQLKNVMPSKEAIIQALDESFATVMTSGTILATSGFVIQFITTDGTIATIGECIGRGTVVSMILVLFVLPQLLYLGTWLIDKTSFSIRLQQQQTEVVGRMQIAGKVKGYVKGYIDAEVYGTVTGDISAKVATIQHEEEGIDHE